DLELVALAAMEARHALLAHRIEAREGALSGGDGLVVEVADQRIRLAPGFCGGLADDDMEAYAEAEAASLGCPELANLGDLCRHVGGRLAPGQIDLHMLGGDLLPGAGGAAEIERRIGLLQRRVEELAALDGEMRAPVVDGLALHQPLPDLQELGRHGIAL